MPEPAPAPVPISMPVPCAPSHACVHDRQVAADLARGGMSPGGMPGQWHVAEDARAVRYQFMGELGLASARGSPVRSFACGV